MLESLILLSVLFLLPIENVISAPYLHLTEANWRTQLADKTVLVKLTFHCDENGDASFNQCMEDLNGVYVAAYDVNSAWEMMQGKAFDINTIALIKNGKVLETSSETYKDFHYLAGFNKQKQWVYQVLTRHGIQFTMPQPDPTKLSPQFENGPVDLNKGLNAIYRFEGNAKDETGKCNDFNVKGNAKLIDNAFYYNGVYDAKSGGEYNAGKYYECAFTNGFGVSVNVKLNTSTEVRRYVVGLGYRCFDFEINNGKLLLSVSNYEPLDAGNKYADDFYELTEIPVVYDEWMNIIFTTDFNSRRLAIMVNGKRYDDILLSKRFIEIFRKQCLSSNDNYGVRLHNYGSGLVLNGFADDIVVYDRKLNSGEMTALFSKYGKNGNNPNPLPIVTDTNWGGTWNTTWGTSLIPARITETNGQIDGTYEHKNGVLRGTSKTVNGVVILEGTWSQSDNKGWFKFTLNDDKTSFTGEWGYFMKPKAGNWNGTRTNNKSKVK